MKRRMSYTKYLSAVLCLSLTAAVTLPMTGNTEIAQAGIVQAAEKTNAKQKTGLVSKVNYSRNFSKTGTKGLKKVKGTGEFSVTGNQLTVSAGKDDETILIDENSPSLKNSEIEFTFDPKNDNKDGMYGIIFRYAKDGSWTFIGQDGHSAKDPDLTTFVMRTSDGKKVKLCTDGQRIYAGREKPYTVKVRVIDDAVTLFLDNIMIFSGEVPGMTTGTGKAGVCYVNNSGAQIQKFNVSSAQFLKAENQKGNRKTISSSQLSVAMDSSFPRVIDYTLKSNQQKLYGQEIPYYVAEINNVMYYPKVTSKFTKDKAVYQVSIPQIGVSFDVVYQVDKNVLNMEITNIKEKNIIVKTINFPNQSLVSVRSSQKNASLHVNNYREDKAVDLSKQKPQKAYQTTSIATISCDTIAASIHNGNINNRQEIAYQTAANGKYTSTGLWSNEFQYKGLDNKVIDKLWTKVAITGDRNADKKVDFQDAAIARRDDIGTEKAGTGTAANAYSMIAMDVGSIAQYPFLRILDNIKKFHAGTDGFEQMILIKGYQSEGHDASHPDYANISERAGGRKDFNVLLDEASKYNAKIGLHINHTEAYPEAKQYKGLTMSSIPGWSWYDDSMHFVRENDILDKKNGLAKRLENLKKLVGDRLSMVYVDTYQDSRWQAHSISDKLKELGWEVGTEYSEELIKNSTWSHTINASNLDYNTTGNLVRFVDNQTKDIFGNSPLFRGLNNRNVNAGFFGWQECKSYDATIENFFTQVLPQKYLANFPVSQWEEKDRAVLGKNNEVVTKIVNGVNQITKDGRLIANGNEIFIPWDAKTEEKIYHWNEKGGITTWYLPDSWKNVTTVKLYQLTDEGRTNETILPVTNQQVSIHAEAKTGYVLYKGSSKVSKTDMTSYEWGKGSPVKDMGFDSHTFGYAWDKSSSAGNTDHIQFLNNASENADTKDKKDNQQGNTHLHIQGKKDGAVTQNIGGLVPGQTYSASVFMEGNEGRKLSISVTTDDNQTVTNHTNSSLIPYGAPHNDRFGTYYQRVKVLFTVPKDSSFATIRLEAEEDGDPQAWANFDNVRVTPVGATDTKGHDYMEDFENVDQEFGPFVCPTKVTQSHLSEKNGNLTKDVIDGRYSLKIRGNGNTEQKFNYMRTAPYSVRLKPNTTYRIGLDYMVTDVLANQDVLNKEVPAFVLGVKSEKALAAGDQKNASLVSIPMKAADTKAVRENTVTFTTGNYDDYYIDLLDETYSHEFIIDNFFVDEVK